MSYSLLVSIFTPTTSGFTLHSHCAPNLSFVLFWTTLGSRAFSVVSTQLVPQLKITDSSFPRNHQPSSSSACCMDFMPINTHLLPHAGIFVGLDLVQALCILLQVLCICVCYFLVVFGKQCCLKDIHRLWVVQFFSNAFSMKIQNFMGRHMMTVPFSTEPSPVSWISSHGPVDCLSVDTSCE